MRGLRPTSLQRCAIAIRSSAVGRDDHEVRAGHVLELLTAGGAGPGVGADREPVAVVDVLAGVLGDLLVVPDDLLDGEQHGAVIHARRIASPPVCRARRRSSRLRGTEPRGTVSRAAPARSACRAPPRGRLRRSALLRELSASAASEPVEELELVDAAAQVSAWCGEPLLYDGDDPAITLAPGTARRRALDAAREEIAAGPRRRRARPGASASRSCSASSACSRPTSPRCSTG